MALFSCSTVTSLIQSETQHPSQPKTLYKQLLAVKLSSNKPQEASYFEELGNFRDFSKSTVNMFQNKYCNIKKII